MKTSHVRISRGTSVAVAVAEGRLLNYVHRPFGALFIHVRFLSRRPVRLRCTATAEATQPNVCTTASTSNHHHYGIEFQLIKTIWFFICLIFFFRFHLRVNEGRGENYYCVHVVNISSHRTLFLCAPLRPLRLGIVTTVNKVSRRRSPKSQQAFVHQIAYSVLAQYASAVRIRKPLACVSAADIGVQQ